MESLRAENLFKPGSVSDSPRDVPGPFTGTGDVEKRTSHEFSQFRASFCYIRDIVG